MVIKGFVCEVQSAELLRHFEERIAYHADRERYYLDQLESLPEVPPGISNSSNDLSTSFRSHRASHRQRAEMFQYYWNHLPVNATFQLSEHELRNLELIK